MLHYVATLLLLASGVYSQNYQGVNLGKIPIPKERMPVSYPNGAALNYGNNVSVVTLANRPDNVGYNANASDLYTYVGLRLNSPNNPVCPRDQFLMEMKINIRGGDTRKTGQRVVQYEPPVVVDKSVILYITLRQPKTIVLNDILLYLNSAAGRACYDVVEEFMEPNGITEVQAGNYGFARLIT